MGYRILIHNDLITTIKDDAHIDILKDILVPICIFLHLFQ